MWLQKKLFGGFYLEIIWNKAGNSFDVLHMPYNNIRKAKDGDGYWYSRDWSNKKQDEETTGLKFIDAFTPEGGKGSQLYCATEYQPVIVTNNQYEVYQQRLRGLPDAVVQPI